MPSIAIKDTKCHIVEEACKFDGPNATIVVDYPGTEVNMAWHQLQQNNVKHAAVGFANSKGVPNATLTDQQMIISPMNKAGEQILPRNPDQEPQKDTTPVSFRAFIPVRSRPI